MHEDKKSDYAPSLLEKLVMWMELRKKIKITKTNIRSHKLLIPVFQSRITPASSKEDNAEVQLKIGQLEAKILADQMALEVFTNLDLNDPALYEPVEE